MWHLATGFAELISGCQSVDGRDLGDLAVHLGHAITRLEDKCEELNAGDGHG